MAKTGSRKAFHPVRVGIGGWSFPEWRDNFYPKGLRQADELAHAAARLGSIEINGTFYRTQTPQTFRSWRAAVPDGFVFSVKAARGAAQRKDAAEAAPSVQRFLGSGLTELGSALGPILWQLPPARRFDADGLARFLDLLPERQDGIALRHVLEARHESFATEPALRLLAERNVALVALDLDPDAPGAAAGFPLTADFAYLRLQATRDEQALGYAPSALDDWARRLRTLSKQREVFAYVIAGAKHRAPAAAQALIHRLEP
ncbi:DUF72 domain-containing protein [Lichenicoccus sp.]|uniref:DUF72 domain-containing protein n=1 Tax=Lichenicoccus sp. TaxID=2781899 RepID=UPI003D136A4B